MSDTRIAVQVADSRTPGDPLRGAASLTPTRLSTGYSWPECPRWRDGALQITDMYNHRIVRLDAQGEPETVVDASTRAPVHGSEVVLGGFGWLPDGRLIVTSMHERLLLVSDGAELTEYADLRDLASGPLNDMVVDSDGRAYVTQLGFELFQGEEPRACALLVVEPDGRARSLDELGTFMCPNGVAVSADGRSVVLAESFGVTVFAFDRAENGVLSRRRIFGVLPVPGDGMCLDADGAAWVASPAGGFVARLLDGGEVTDVVRFDQAQVIPTSCVLGGQERRTLYITGGLEVFDWQKSRQEAQGSVWTAPAPVTGGTARP